MKQGTIDRYHEDGYVAIRGAVSAQACEQLKQALLERARANRCTISVPRDKVFPDPAKYTLAANDWAHPDLAFIVEHPSILDAVESVLGKPPVLTAYVAYIRPPGDTGTRPHCDHKRWRPVGSSLNWCFAIVALTDFTADVGALKVCPGSHKLIQPKRKDGGRVLSVSAPDKSRLGPYVDAELRRGDLLLMHGNTWHEAPANLSDEFRVGIFNKYAACDAPPATGYFKWNCAVYDSLGSRGKGVLAVHTDRTLGASRLVLERVREEVPEVLLLGNDTDGWSLPGGRVDEQRNRALEAGLDGAWDTGNLIGAMEDLCTEQLGWTPSWMSYLSDHEEDDYLCRVYATTLTSALSESTLPANARWFPISSLERLRIQSDYLREAITAWFDDSSDVIRGKGKSEKRCVPTGGVNQFLD